MKILNGISDLTNLFHKDDDNRMITIFWNSLYIAFLLLPIGINLPTPFFVVSILLGVINIFKSSGSFAKDNKVLFFFPIYFLIIALSLVYTDNISDGLKLVQRSLTLFLFPIIFLFVKEDATSVKKLFDFLLFGLIISFFLNFSFAIYNSFEGVKESLEIDGNWIDITSSLIDAIGTEWNNILMTEFSTLVNPNYISLYILLVLSYYLKKEVQTRRRLVVLIILFLYLFLLASPAAYFMLCIMAVILVRNIKDKGKRYLMYATLILGVIVFSNNPRISDFYKHVRDIDTDILENDNEIITIEKSRLLTWNASIQLIKEAPVFGYGIGDANDVLIQKYKELNYFYNYQNRYNAHNQFLQTFLQTGVIGFAMLVSIFMLLAIRMRRSRNEFSVFLILFIALFFESMLVRFNGIVFFSIIIPLLLKKRSILSGRIIRNYSNTDNPSD